MVFPQKNNVIYYELLCVVGVVRWTRWPFRDFLAVSMARQKRPLLRTSLIKSSSKVHASFLPISPERVKLGQGRVKGGCVDEGARKNLGEQVRQKLFCMN